MADTEGTSGDGGATSFPAEQLALINKLVRAGIAAGSTTATGGSGPSGSVVPVSSPPAGHGGAAPPQPTSESSWRLDGV